MNRYDIFSEGDLVTAGDPGWDDVGIVVDIGKHKQVHVYWPSSQKITKSGHKWAEINFEIIIEGFSK